MGPAEFKMSAPGADRFHRHHDRAQYLVFLQGGFQVVQEKFVSRDLSPSGLTGCLEHGIGRDQGAGKVGIGIGMADGPADRAHITDGGMGDLPGGVPDDCRVAGQPVIAGNLRMGRRSADAYMVPGYRNTGKFINTSQSDQRRRLNQVRIQHGHKGGAAGKTSGLIVFRKNLKRFTQAVGFDVFHGLISFVIQGCYSGFKYAITITDRTTCFAVVMGTELILSPA